MIIWFAMLIPLVGCAIAFKMFQHKLVFWELLLPSAMCFVVILVTKFATESSLLADTQYRGAIIVEARYYEYWSSWVRKTCTERYKCGSHYVGSGKDRHSVDDYCTRQVDCSYCDRNSAYWEVYDNQGNSWRITEAKYKRLILQWKATPKFVDQNRRIVEHGGCGEDGDMYSIHWDGDMLSVEASTWSTSYENHVQVSKSNFNLMDVSDEEATKYNLYKYPVIDNYQQHNLLGLDSLRFIESRRKIAAAKMFEYFNGYYGPKRKLRVYVLFFNNKSIDIAVKQKNYWDGGNKNEVVICIDVDRNTGKLNWVYPITWTENKRISVDLREDIMNMDTLNLTKLYYVVEKSTEAFTYRDFHQYDYLAVDPPTWEVWFVYLMTLGITIGLLYFAVVNEFKQEEC